MLGCIRAVARPGRSLIRPTLAPSSTFPSPFGFFLFKNKESSTDPSTYPADGGVHHHGPCSGWNSMTSSLRWAAGQFCSSRSKHTHFDQLCHFFRPSPLLKWMESTPYLLVIYKTRECCYHPPALPMMLRRRPK